MAVQQQVAQTIDLDDRPVKRLPHRPSDASSSPVQERYSHGSGDLFRSLAPDSPAYALALNGNGGVSGLGAQSVPRSPGLSAASLAASLAAVTSSTPALSHEPALVPNESIGGGMGNGGPQLGLAAALEAVARDPANLSSNNTSIHSTPTHAQNEFDQLMRAGANTLQAGDGSIHSSSNSGGGGNNTSAATTASTSVATITRIGCLLDRVSDLAQAARQSFIEGQHAQSSICLGDLQRSLTEIGELGARSLALVNERQPLSAGAEAGPTFMQRAPSYGHRRTMTESAVKKRPLAAAAESMDDFDYAAFTKTVKAGFLDDGAMSLEAAQQQQPLPPPSAPPTLLDPTSANNTTPMMLPPVSAPPEHPPSAPPFFNSDGGNGGSGKDDMLHAGMNQAALAAAAAASMPPSSNATMLLSQQLSAQPSPFGMQAPVLTHSQSAIGSMPAPSMSATTSTSSTSNSLAAMLQQHRHSIGNGVTTIPISSTVGHQQMSKPPSPSEVEAGGAFSHYQEDESTAMAETGLLASERGMSGAMVPAELKGKLDELFFAFLEEVCSDVNYCDSKGEHLHQILTAKKMSRSSISSPIFKAFKFRIQAFTNAFHENVVKQLGGEEECNLKQTRAYLWTSNYIARFNESGVKEKSKGNHVWRVEARKNGEGRFEFREFKRKIIAPAQVAYHGMEWSWPLRIWDPQAPSTSIKAVFAAHDLPHWIRWKEGDQPVLYGTPDGSAQSTQITVTAHYVARGHQQLVKLAATVDLHVTALVEPILPNAGQSLQAAQPTSFTQPPAEDAMMDDVRVEQAETVIAPGQVPHVISQIGFPYTPPATFGSRPNFFEAALGQGGGESVDASPLVTRQPLPSAPLPQMRGAGLQPFEQVQQNQIRELIAKQEHAAATMPLNMPAFRRKSTTGQSTDESKAQGLQEDEARAAAQQQQQQQQQQQHQHHQQQQAAMMAQQQLQHQAAMAVQQQQQFEQQQQEFERQSMQNQAQAQLQAQMQAQMQPPTMAAFMQSGMPQSMNTTIQQQQQQHDGGGMVEKREGGGALQGVMGHSGLTLTPMSSLPQMASQLPQMSINSSDPMLSPAIPIGFDPIAHEGARIAMTQQQQQQQQQHSQQQQQQQQQTS